MTNPSTTSAEGLRDRISHLGDIRLKKMFGGHGVFVESTMFALVDRTGDIYFKGDDTNMALFTEAGSHKHSRMPYYYVPAEVLEDEDTLEGWAQSSMLVARSNK